jgi:hypothetical protein
VPEAITIAMSTSKYESEGRTKRISQLERLLSQSGSSDSDPELANWDHPRRGEEARHKWCMPFLVE